MRRIEVGEGMAVLVEDDGTHRFEHDCDRGERGRFTTAPALRVGPHGPGHEIAQADPLTITPSVLCPDCGTHGFVRDGAWEAA